MRSYPDGKLIPESLPQSYQSYVSRGVPPGEYCGTCKHFEGEYCNKFKAPVRKHYWCDFWEKKNGIR